MSLQRVNIVLPHGVNQKKREYHFLFETLEDHPVLQLHSTSEYRRISFLIESDGILYVGYGDINADLGPVQIIGYNLETLSPVTVFGPVPSEGLHIARKFDGALYFPWTDPKGSGPGGFTTNRSGEWENVVVDSPFPIHFTHDLLKHDGAILLCGRTTFMVDGVPTYRGAVWRESPNGEWAIQLVGSKHGAYDTFRKFSLYKEKIFVTNPSATPYTDSWESEDGITWSPTTTPADALSDGTRDWMPNPFYLRPGLSIQYPHTTQAYLRHDGWQWVGGAGKVSRGRLPS